MKSGKGQTQFSHHRFYRKLCKHLNVTDSTSASASISIASLAVFSFHPDGSDGRRGPGRHGLQVSSHLIFFLATLALFAVQREVKWLKLMLDISAEMTTASFEGPQMCQIFAKKTFNRFIVGYFNPAGQFTVS